MTISCLQTAVAERDQLRIELGRFGATFRNKQDVVDEQVGCPHLGRGGRYSS